MSCFKFAYKCVSCFVLLFSSLCPLGIIEANVYKANAFERTTINTLLGLTTELREMEGSQDVDRMVSIMLQIQSIVEKHLDVKINAEPIFDELFSDYQNNLGLKFHPQYLSMFKSKLKIGVLSNVLNNMGPDRKTIDGWMIKPGLTGNKSKKKTEKELNPKLAHGITISCAGAFLRLVPAPPLVKIGTILIGYGATLVYEGYFYEKEKQYDNRNKLNVK